MSDVEAVRVFPTWAVPVISGLPVACLFGGVSGAAGAVLLVTAWPVKEAAALPTRSCSRAADSPVGAV